MFGRKKPLSMPKPDIEFVSANRIKAHAARMAQMSSIEIPAPQPVPDVWSVTRIVPPADRTRRYMGKLHIMASDEDTARENLRQFLRQRGSAAKVEDFRIHRLVCRLDADYGVIDSYMVDP